MSVIQPLTAGLMEGGGEHKNKWSVHTAAEYTVVLYSELQYSGCRITFLSLKKLFVFPFFRIARIGGNAQIILGKCKNYFKEQKNAFEIILVYRNISII